MSRYVEIVDHLIDPDFTSEKEGRSVVPVSSVHKRLYELATLRSLDFSERQRIMARYSPLAEWLTTPTTIDGFIHLRDRLLYLAWQKSDRELAEILDVEPSEAPRWKEPLVWLFSLASELRILDWERLKRFRGEEKNIGAWQVEKKADRIDRDGGFRSLLTYLEGEDKLLYLSIWMEDLKQDKGFYKPVSRVGLIFGDFRVGDHSAHRRLIENAREAVGENGWLQIIIPSRKTILTTTNKTDVWDDEERVGRLEVIRDVDHVLCVDMPERYYSDPDQYWREVWTAVKPDLIFLGEDNHPLEEKFKLQSRILGGILLVDPEPVTRRSSDLLAVK
jgi:glycerol-3-phosphate cytidylyltransferase-like family protein